MNELIDKLHTQAILVTGSGACTAGEFDHAKFAELILTKVITRIEEAINDAYELDDITTATTLEALAVTVLDDFDMQLPDQG